MDRELREALWAKSPFSGGNGGNCVEIAKLPGGRVGVRDSKDRSGPALVFTPSEWTAFTRWVRTDDTV
ncbi:DUF397 domain-containing protein [Planomonospora sp. ID67723]|uniref:DUF397 domain-containing protein n=1 Tax=Planomonospora sp. ID67723 TaxID=2738134 RepID=UPI0018C3EC8E|nr:DUF397 domain-containing protein [Planomonospora sp. ID67723]MBG0829244.1 DUF397 domain-containing protein [Planomonospora sp. ID67723]